jgi:DNA-binding MarR family transcriptional regulator
MATSPRTLGTLLRTLLDQLDGAVEEAYTRSGLDYRPRFTPIVRALIQFGPASISDLAGHIGLTHSAVSQTVVQMKKQGLVRLRSGKDARERIAILTAKAKALVPVLKRHWAATEAAALELDQDLARPLTDVVLEALAALDRKPFLKRIEQASQVLNA